MLKLSFWPSHPAKVKNVVMTVWMTTSSSGSSSAPIRAEANVLTCPHRADQSKLLRWGATHRSPLVNVVFMLLLLNLRNFICKYVLPFL